MNRICMVSSATALVCILGACGGGGSSVQAPGGGSVATAEPVSLVPAVTTHRNGKTASIGLLDADGHRQGYWSEFDDSGRPTWDGWSIDDVKDPTRYWCQWAADGSIVADWQRPGGLAR